MMRVFSTNVKYVALLCCVGGLLGSCNVINPVEPTPTYIHIDSFQFLPNYSLNPAALTFSHDITQVWAYYNGVLIGEFDLPCTFPVITNSTQTGKLQLWAGTVIDGYNNTLDIYPFYIPDTSLVVNFKPGTTTNYTPKTTYYTKTKISEQVKYDFETSFIPFKLASGNCSLQVINNDTSLAFYSSGVGSIYMSNPAVDSSEDSTGSFNIPSGAAYIEFNYKTDVQFYVGLQGTLGGSIIDKQYLIGIAPSSGKWRKFYLNVKEFAMNHPGGIFNLFIKTSLPAGQATGRVLLDNIQLVTF